MLDVDCGNLALLHANWLHRNRRSVGDVLTEAVRQITLIGWESSAANRSIHSRLSNVSEDHGVLETTSLLRSTVSLSWSTLLIEEVTELEVWVNRTCRGPHTVVGVEVQVEVDTDLLKPVHRDLHNAAFNIDLQRTNGA